MNPLRLFSRGDRPTADEFNELAEKIGEVRHQRGTKKSRERIFEPFWAKIVTFSKHKFKYPDDQSSTEMEQVMDYCDSRYHVWEIQHEFFKAPYVCNENPPQGFVDSGDQWLWTFDHTQGERRWVTAVNLAEVDANTHSLEAGTIVRVYELKDIYGNQFFAFHSGGGGGGGASGEVKIHKAIAEQGDYTPETKEEENWIIHGPHLSCVRVKPDGSTGDPLTEPIAVFPVKPHIVADFKNADGSQIYNSVDPDDPHFFIVSGHKGATLHFGVGQTWVAPPEPGELCA